MGPGTSLRGPINIKIPGQADVEIFDAAGNLKAAVSGVPTLVASGKVAAAAPTTGANTAGTVPCYAFAVAGAQTTDLVVVSPTGDPKHGTGPIDLYALVGFVSSAGNVTVYAYNPINFATGTPLPSSGQFNFSWAVIRP